MDAESENDIQRLKSNILEAYRTYRPTRHNIDKSERKAIGELKEQKLIIKCSDKSKSLVAMSDTVYRGKAENILANTEDYELADMTAEALEQMVTDVLKGTRNLKNLPPDVYNGLFPRKTSLPQFYGLPKIHKANAPLRPVVAAFDGPLTAISILLERILHQL